MSKTEGNPYSINIIIRTKWKKSTDIVLEYLHIETFLMV